MKASLYEMLAPRALVTFSLLIIWQCTACFENSFDLNESFLERVSCTRSLGDPLFPQFFVQVCCRENAKNTFQQVSPTSVTRVWLFRPQVPSKVPVHRHK